MPFLAMRLATARPVPSVVPAHLAFYRAAKRFLSLLENGGATSLMVLQSMVLIAYFEYAHGVYPAAWITIVSCVRYADFVGLPELHKGNVLLEAPTPADRWQTTMTELEERSKAWWAILVLDRIIYLGNQKSYLSPEPHDTEAFPIDDEDWPPSPRLILDALYGAGNTLAWLFREEGSPQYENEMKPIKRCLERLGARWRLVGEYRRMLEQQDLAFMMQEKGHSTMGDM
ncbi:hypothetical protein CTA2_8030 [Colletotrichum tanaceti]|uniref:Xylanolytic transcriptional activator regulatory domain-containing protein n=1 Tax=Colletotrichum tanaceti TaxID=1306861 RepID=A0A4U6XUT4_9PEZI|nr:hypothetical protein CTA2_8030 [Colletotrichum tanaceti]TKW59712.1 hypothetical protein CTA1_10470 [Colletotrichum tanaceti]